MAQKRGLESGSVYEQIYKLIRDNPGFTTRDISQQLNLTIEDVAKRCHRLSERNYLVKRPISSKKNRKIVSDAGWYITDDAPDDAYSTHCEELLYLYDKENRAKKFEYNCFKAKEMFGMFGKVKKEGTPDRSARNFIKDYIKVIDLTYGSIININKNYSIKITYLPIVGTLKDIYKIGFQLYFDQTALGYIRKIRLDLESNTFYFDIDNVSVSIRFTTLQQAYSRWMKVHNGLRKKFIERYENNLLTLDDIEDELSMEILEDLF